MADRGPKTTKATVPEQVDLTAFTSKAECLRLAGEGCPTAYTSIARDALAQGQLTHGLMLLMAMVSRTRGLHEAILRELDHSNPHAVLPLMRAWVELATINMYAVKRPRYIGVLLSGVRSKDAGARKSFTSMFAAIRDDAAGLADIYQQLSEYTHFGPLAIYNVHTVTGKNSVTWQDAPHWRNDSHFRVACAQTRELAEVSRDQLPLLAALVQPVVDGCQG